MCVLGWGGESRPEEGTQASAVGSCPEKTDQVRPVLVPVPLEVLPGVLSSLFLASKMGHTVWIILTNGFVVAALACLLLAVLGTELGAVCMLGKPLYYGAMFPGHQTGTGEGCGNHLHNNVNIIYKVRASQTDL